MNDIQIKQKEELGVWTVVEDKQEVMPHNLTQVNNTYHVYMPAKSNAESWLSAIHELHPITQIIALVAILSLGYFSLGFISLALTGLATFILGLLAMITNFAIIVGGGVGILVLVVLGISAIINV
jgi:hypothetical protein